MPGRSEIDEEKLRGSQYGTDQHRRRRQVLNETLARFEQDGPRLRELAAENLARWAGASDAGPAPVAVVRGDWGEVTARMTRQYGRTFAALNMANAYLPGGGYREGAAAQEENMFRRTDCHFSVDDALVAKGHYVPEMSRLLNGEDGRVLLDLERPRTCFRGAEEGGYPWLADDEVFPFFELRAAARNCREKPFDAADARRRVGALLDTLTDAGQRHAVLGAWGCGAFCNPPRDVAQIFREELEHRAGAFDCVVFAIHDARHGPDNAGVFERVFAG